MNDPLDETLHDRPLDPAGAEAASDARSILLVIVAGSEVDFGRHFVLEREEATIGRGDGCDIVVRDAKASKAHCAVAVLLGSRGVERIEIRDLETTNGTFVNNERVSRATLMAGDKVRVGDTVLQLRYGDGIEREYHSRLFQLAARDALTGLYNKRFIANELDNQARIARRSGRPLSVILVDLDDFKQVNDRFGHLAGDEYLAGFAGLLARTLREQDIAGRVGGEEFLVVLPETAVEGALQLAERIRQCAAEFVLARGGEDIRATVSAGVCQYERGMRDVKELLDLADRAMYEAKKAEKNKVMRALLADIPGE
jgi:diguanylate cyclase (GGDEF)-like protein